jgi:hypothetical protein
MRFRGTLRVVKAGFRTRDKPGACPWRILRHAKMAYFLTGRSEMI